MAGNRWIGVWCALVALSAGAAGGKVLVSVEAGWGGAYRAEHWCPVLVTVQDSTAGKPRNGILTITSPYGIQQNLKVSQRIVISGTPSTFVVYLPLSGFLSDTIATVREDSGKIVAEVAFDQRRQNPDDIFNFGINGQGELVIGVSGRRTTLPDLGTTIDWVPQQQAQDEVAVRVGYLPPSLLPDTIMGFDTLDLLVLHSPDLAGTPGGMSREKQQAIVDWVRAGGKLLMWPGDGVVPPDSPLAAVLPVELGEVRPTELTVEETKKLGIAARIERLPGRAITGKPGTRAISFLPGKAQGVEGRVGYGRIVVLPYDASALTFTNPETAMKVWRPFLAEVLKPPHLWSSYVDGKNQSLRYMTSNDVMNEENWRLAAMEQVIDRLGNVPGIGRFDFSYVAWVLLAMMIIVGPVDWFVLKKLGRQPWTWATITGWCVLITVGALYMGQVFKSGDLHYRTLKMVEQDGDRVVAVSEVAGIYTPKTASFAVKGSDYLWWQPAKMDASERYRQRRSILAGFELVQDRRGQQMRMNGDEPAMVVPIWNLRFMQGTDGQPGDTKAVIAADLTLSGKSGTPGRALKGSITNLSKGTMRNVCVWVNEGVAMATKPNQSPEDYQAQRAHESGNVRGGVRTPVRVDGGVQAEVPSGKTIEVGTAVHLAGRELVMFGKPITSSRGIYYSSSSSGSSADVMVPEMEFVRAAAGLSPERTRRVLEMFERGEPVACVMAEIEMDASDVKLVQGGKMAAKEKHWQVVRAIVPLKREE